MCQAPQLSTQRGFTIVEVMVSVLILAVGLLGLAGLQARTLNGQFEAYQRAQAMLLAEDMAARIRSNPSAARAGNYGGSTVYGLVSQVCDNSAIANSVGNDQSCWSEALRGASVTSGTTQLGSIIGARGCIENLSGGAGEAHVIRVSVAWQGVSPTVAPSQSCGQDSYGDDRLRRVVSIDVTLAYLGE